MDCHLQHLLRCWTTTTHNRTSVQRKVVMRVHRNIIVLAATAWVESLCQWGRVVVVVHCSAVECDHWGSQRPTRDLHCPVISDQATWRQWMFSVDNQWRVLHSPTHTHTHTHTHIDIQHGPVANRPLRIWVVHVYHALRQLNDTQQLSVSICCTSCISKLCFWVV